MNNAVVFSGLGPPARSARRRSPRRDGRLIQWTVGLSLLAALGWPAHEAAAIPAWARKYNMNCSSCHFPVVPRLNATGLEFKWAGYRMPNEIGEKMEVRKIEEYMAAQAVVEHNYAKTDGQSVEVNAISVPCASLYVGGPLGTNYGAFVQFERGPAGGIDLIAQLAGAWGDESRFGSVRVGTGHALAGGMVAGFDRATGILQPLAIAGPVTAAIPFMYGGDATELEFSLVLDGRNRTSVQILNGLASPTAAAGSSTTQMDFGVTNQFIWGKHGDGLTATANIGSITGLDASATTAVSDYYRLALSANKWISNFELVGGYVYGRDSKLPVGGASPFASASLTGTGYWVSGLYAFPTSFVSVYGRYEGLDPDRDVTNGGLQRVVFGGIVPVIGPPYLRLAVEFFLDMPQLSGAPKRQGVTTQLQFNF